MLCPTDGNPLRGQATAGVDDPSAAPNDRDGDPTPEPISVLPGHGAGIVTKRALDVLVVEDHDASRAGVERAVRELGHRPRSACDGAAALASHTRHPADVILCDWRLPKLDGPQVCRRIRQLDEEHYTYFVFLSAYGDRDHVRAGMAAGADDYLVKPVDLEELAMRLQTAERITRRYDALASENERLRATTRRSERLAHTDPLTGVGNRRRFDEDLVRALNERRKRALCLGMCDIDQFKLFNDGFGHPEGDKALARVARAIVKSLRRTDRVYRYGGEELAFMVEEPNLEGAVRAAERARASVEACGLKHAPDAIHDNLTISIGVTMATSDDSPLTLVERADRALYKAKGRGRNQVVALPTPGSEG